jgi:cytosine/adenosine deaminase-related metal-dependent hydrolase
MAQNDELDVLDPLRAAAAYNQLQDRDEGAIQEREKHRAMLAAATLRALSSQDRGFDTLHA